MKLSKIRDLVKSMISLERARDIKKRIEIIYRLVKLPAVAIILIFLAISIEGPTINQETERLTGFVTGKTYGNTIQFSEAYEINRDLPYEVVLRQEDYDKVSVRMYVEMEKSFIGKYSITNTRQAWEDEYESNEE